MNPLFKSCSIDNFVDMQNAYNSKAGNAMRGYFQDFISLDCSRYPNTTSSRTKFAKIYHSLNRIRTAILRKLLFRTVLFPR